ncbi:helix-turn-helix transcriptional regulator [Metaclostridioides mangenotii]|uniref:helix-turn-helix transcriptional regulator n=1 Tax=Metaclostridioides mangenotii TaxID=1540 RepID=UPI000464E7B2|nr:helix-turn-helix transcriptional regulator [Clostridioides mangenotii]
MKNNIKNYRKNLNLIQEDVAKKLNVTRQTINAIENKKYNPSLELAIKLSILLDVTVEESHPNTIYLALLT